MARAARRRILEFRHVRNPLFRLRPAIRSRPERRDAVPLQEIVRVPGVVRRQDQGVAREELRSEKWLRRMAELGGRSYEQMRVAILEFLDTDVFNVSIENCVSFLDPMIDSWDIDLKTFGMEVVLNRRLAPGRLKRFEFVEQEPQHDTSIEPGLEQFLLDKSLSGDITEEEIEFLRTLKFRVRRPAALYYYRELQSLRDPLHFTFAAQPKASE